MADITIIKAMFSLLNMVGAANAAISMMEALPSDLFNQWAAVYDKLCNAANGAEEVLNGS